MISAICESFGCTPSQALAEDPKVVLPILTYRLARGAKDQFNQDSSKITEAQAKIMQEMAELLEERQGD